MPETMRYILGCVILFYGMHVICQELYLTSKTDYFIVDEPLEITCSSNQQPTGESVSFWVNGAPLMNLRYLPSTRNCYAIPQQQPVTAFVCNTTCSCANNSKSFTWNYNASTSDDHLTVTCKMYFDLKEVTKLLTVYKAHGPTLITVLPNELEVYVTEGHPIGPIICSANCTPLCNYTWVGPEISMSSGKLEISNATKSNNGGYTCIAENLIGNATLKIEITIQYGPVHIDLFPPNVNYSMTENTNIGPILCLSVCSPTCTFSWIGPDFSTSSNSLFISKIHRNQTGTFSCVAENFIGTVKSNITVDVQYGPSSIVLFPLVSIIDVNRLDSVGPISCMADCKPGCTYSWNGPGIEGRVNTLHFSKVYVSDNGTYTCMASNKYSSTTVRLQIFVQSEPFINPRKQNSDQTVWLHIGEPLFIRLYVIAYPNPTISWTFKSKSSDKEMSILSFDLHNGYEHSTSVYFPDTNSSLIGDFTVNISNKLGHFNRTFNTVQKLSIEDFMTGKSMFQTGISTLSVGSITLLVAAIIICYNLRRIKCDKRSDEYTDINQINPVYKNDYDSLGEHKLEKNLGKAADNINMYDECRPPADSEGQIQDSKVDINVYDN